MGTVQESGKRKKKERLYLMNSLVRSVAMYGVEVWGWGNLEGIKKVQARYCKFALGLAKNTPKYIWRREMRVEEIEWTVRKRVCRYIKDIMEMEEERWPKVCLKEEMRAITNGKESKWGKDMKEVLGKFGTQQICKKV